MGKRAVLVIVLIALAASCLALPPPANAASRTIVVPDDYPTIAAAISNASKGDIILVKKGTYDEKTLEITKPLSIVGEGAESTKINLSPELIVSFPPDLPPDVRGLATTYQFEDSIKVDADGFRLEGFKIDAPNIADFLANHPTIPNVPGGTISAKGNQTQIVGNSVKIPVSINGSYCNVSRNTLLGDTTAAGSWSTVVENTFTGYIWAYGSYLNISANTKASSNKVKTMDMGIHVEGSSCLIYGNNLTAKELSPGVSVDGNGNVIAKNLVDRSDIGLRISGSNNIICGNTITNSKEDSFLPSPTPIDGIGLEAKGNNTFYANHLENNSWGVNVNQFQTDESSVFFHNNFMGNDKQVATYSRDDWYGGDGFDDGKEGNYWSDYAGGDADGNGIGDVPYVIDAKRSDRYPLMTALDIDSVIISLPEWDSEPIESESFPTVYVVAVSVIAAVSIAAGAGLLLYHRKHRAKAEQA